MGFTIVLTGILSFFLFYGKIPAMPLALITAVFCTGLAFFLKRHPHHGGFLSIDSRAQNSRLNRLHPSLKTCFSFGCIFLCIAADSLTVSLFLVITMTILTVSIGKIPIGYYLTLLTIPFTFILLGTVAILFEISPNPFGLLDISIGGWYLCVTQTGQAKALSLICKAFGAVSCLYMLSLSTPMHRIIGVLRRLHLPAVVVELMYLIYRYIFVLLETQGHMKNAAESRLGYRNYRTSIKTMLSSSMNLLFLSLRRSSDCFTAMEARCYDGEIGFLEDTPFISQRDVLAVLCYSAVLLTICLLSFRGMVL